MHGGKCREKKKRRQTARLTGPDAAALSADLHRQPELTDPVTADADAEE